MLSLRPGTDIVVRAILITAVLLNGLTPGLAFAKPSNLQNAEPTATPTGNVTETATEEPTVTPIESPTPTVTETVVPTHETATPIATGTPAETSTPPVTEAVTPTVNSETPILSLSSDPGFLNPAGVLTLFWVIEGVSSDGLTLQLVLPEGFSPQGSYNGTYDDSSHTLTLTLASLMGEVQLRTNIPGADALIQAHLLNNNELIASADLFLPAHERFVLDQEGGEIIALNGKVKVHFPKDALPEKAVIEIGTPAGDATPPYSLLGMPFEIKAHGKESGQELKYFSKELSIIVSYADLDIQPGLERSLYLYWYNELTGDWEALSSYVDSKTKTLQAVTDHFTVFDINANNWQANHLPTVDAFQVSTFTGAATYTLPIEVPSGPGGFQPSISLNYNSQIVDQSTVETQASWVGMGWALEMGSIERNTNGTPDQNIDDSYMLNVGGISTYIVQDSTEVYHTADENFWKVQYNSGTDTWQLWDKEGNQYFFEKRSRYPYTPVDCDSHNLTYLWSLTKQKNIFGQEIIYSYATETKNLKYWTTSTCSAWSIVAYETAIYPYTITYAGGKYRIRFERDLRTDYTSSWYTDVAFHNFQRYRLEDIFVEQDHNSDGIYETIRRYDLAYGANEDPDIIFPGVTWSAGGKTLTLRSVRQYGAGGINSLPPVTFSYDNLHLTAATNGYGGKVQFQYEEKPYYFPDGRYSYTRYDRVGLPATKRPGTAAVYWPAGSCYEGGTSWKAKSYPNDIVECDEDDGLLIQGTAYSTWFGARELFRPGGVYKFSTSIWTQNASLTPRLFDGSSEKAEENGVILLPKTASQFEVRVKTSNNQIVSVASVKMQLLTSVYRVTSKRVFDGSTVDGQENVYQYTYTYENPAVNDIAHSASVCPNPPQENCNEYIEMFSEFRGHSQVTETGPDGVNTTTLFYQDDILKGRPISVTTSASATNISRVDYAYGNIPLPYVPPHPVWCTLCPAYIGLYRNWVFTDYEKTTLYGDTPTYTRVDYVYDTSSTTSYSYGNLIEKKDQTSPDGVNNWSDYRKWIYYYWPKNTTTQYLVGLPGKEKVFDALGNTLGITIYLYDYNTGDHQIPPTEGKLTSVRTLAQNGVDYSQVSYEYDTYGNRKSTTLYSGYATWSANPTTGSAYKTYTCYGGGYTLGGVECANVGTYTLPLWSINPLGHQTSWTYDYSKGVPLTETDPNGNTTSAQYDTFGRITKLIRPGDDSVNPTIEMQYFDPNLHVTGLIKDPYTVTLTQRIQGSQRYLISRKYDGMGRQTWVTSGSASGVDQTYVQTIYPVRNQSVTTGPMETRQSQPYSSGEQPQFTITTIDPAANTTTVESPDGSTTVNDTYGLVTTVTDANGNQTRTEKDVWGRVYRVIPQNSSANPIGPDVNYEYDELDRLIKVTRGDAVTTIKYDYAGRKIGMDDPDMGTSGTPGDPDWAWTYQYDALGNLTYQKDARGCELRLGYDPLNRPTSKSTGLGCSTTLSNSYFYDQGANGIGRRTYMTDASGSTSWNYDTRGRMIKESKTIDAQTYYTWWAYNSADLVDKITYPDGEEVTNKYNDRMLLTELIGTDTYIQSSKYDASSRLTERLLGNDLTQTFQYYDWNEKINMVGQGGRLESATIAKATHPNLIDTSYVYDPVGNIRMITDTTSTPNEVQTFNYDALDRLINATVTDGPVPYAEGYTYDPATGNLDTKGAVDLGYATTSPVHAVRTAGANSYDYDPNGNQYRRIVGGQTYLLGYDAENHLVSVSGPSLNASFVYDGDGRRVKSVINGETKRFVNELYETEGDPQPVNTNITFQTNTPALPNAAFTKDENWKETKSSQFPATSIWKATWGGTSAPHSGPSAYAISNQNYGYLVSDSVTATPGSQYTVSVWVRGQIDPDDVVGGWILRVNFYNSSGQSISYQDIAGGTSLTTTWTQKSGAVTAPANAATQKVWLVNYLSSGWVAFDDASVVKVGTSTNLIANPGFETANNWTTTTQSGFPATGFWRSTWGTATPHSGTYAYVISNHSYAQITSDPVPAIAGQRYDVRTWLRGQIDPSTVVGGWLVRVNFYNASGASIGYADVESGTSLSTTWITAYNRITAPANVATQRLSIIFYMASGWMAIEDASITTPGAWNNTILNPNFETTSNWSVWVPSGFPATSVWHGSGGIATPLSGSYSYAMSNQAYGDVSSATIPVSPNKQYDVSAWVRGKLDPTTTFSGMLMRASFLDSNGSLISYNDFASGKSLTTTWQQKSSRLTAPANATSMKLQFFNYLASGWAAFDDPSVIEAGKNTNLVPNPEFITITYDQKLSGPITVNPGTPYSLSALVKGNGGSATGNWAVRIHYYDASGVRLTPFTDVGSSTSSTTTASGQATGGQFITPANAASIRISLSSALTAGTLAIENATLNQAADRTKYYFAGTQRIAMRTNGTLSYLLSDHLGSTSLVVKDTITGLRADDVVSEMRYKAWGEVRYEGGTTTTDYTYSGQYSDSYINLLWYGSRHYDPELGRFIQPDTIVPLASQGVQAWDRYAYVNNAPTRYTDPTGHRACGDEEAINCETGLLNNPTKNNKGCRQGECLGITRNPCLMRRFDCQPKLTEPGGITPSASSNEVIEFTDYGPETMPTINGRTFRPAYGGMHKGLSIIELALMGIEFLHYNTGVYSEYSGNTVQGVIPVVHDNVSGKNIIPGVVVYNDTGYYVLVEGVSINNVSLEAGPLLIPSGGAGDIQFTDPAFLPTTITDMSVEISFAAYQSNGVLFGFGQSRYDGPIYYGPPLPP